MRIKNNYDLRQTGLYFLVLFFLLRPIITILEGKTPVPVQSIFPVLFFFIALFLLILTFKGMVLDFVSFTILFFTFYCVASMLWGSRIASVLEIIIPFSGFFFIKIFANSFYDIKKIINSVLIGYSIPIVFSAILMFAGLSVHHVVYGSGVQRQIGLYVGYHVAAHSMSVFSFYFSFFLFYKDSEKKYYYYIFFVLFFLSLYCLWNTYVRSAMLTIFVFWIFYFYKANKKYLIYIIILLSILGIWKFSNLESIIWKADTWDRERNIETASSGRTNIWRHNLNVFSSSPFYRKIMGNGLGSEGSLKNYADNAIWDSHNDFLSILMTLGIFGILQYLAIFMAILLKIIQKRRNKVASSIYLSIIIAYFISSSVTNGYLFRIEVNQLFWLIIGCADLTVEEQYAFKG